MKEDNNKPTKRHNGQTRSKNRHLAMTGSLIQKNCSGISFQFVFRMTVVIKWSNMYPEFLSVVFDIICTHLDLMTMHDQLCLERTVCELLG